MRAFVGTSGFSYKEWKGHFYPERIKPNEMLEFYSSQLTAVEVNNTFYRLPRQSVLEGWRDAVPDSFRFSVKVSRRITHFRRLKPESANETGYLMQNVAALGAKLGVLFFQLPPDFAADPPRLEEYLASMPSDSPLRAFEFRNQTWFVDEVFEILRRYNAALCIADSEDRLQVPVVSTADWGYLRLRRKDYTPEDLIRWKNRIDDFGWSQTFAFFKHEDAGAGPRLARDFLTLVDSGK